VVFIPYYLSSAAYGFNSIIFGLCRGAIKAIEEVSDGGGE